MREVDVNVNVEREAGGMALEKFWLRILVEDVCMRERDVKTTESG